MNKKLSDKNKGRETDWIITKYANDEDFKNHKVLEVVSFNVWYRW
jgi:hypothetical protein